MSALHIQIPSLIENIRIVESFIDNAKEKYAINDDVYGNIMIAITEAVNNAIIHGNKSDKDKNVSLSLEMIDGSSVKFSVEDQGKGFDYQNLSDPTAPENLENPGGRGIFLMKQLADEVIFLNHGKRVELIFYLI
jgi:serine/threonine-protein kinase RsbW